MATQRITFGEWLPDQPGLSGALTTANNVISQSIGYGPFKSAANIASGASDDLVTLHTTKNSSNDSLLFAAGLAKIFKVSAIGVYTKVSPATDYTTATADRIRFSQFGKSVITTNNSEKLQYYNVDTSTEFADLDATAPVAKYITVVRDFVVVANLTEGADKYSSRVRWSGINDETDWTYSQTSQADYQTLPDGGNIVGIRGGEFGLVFMDNAIYRMSYLGTPLIFQFDNISRGTGCFNENSIAQYSGLSFFLSDDGFYVCDGQTLKPIGTEKVDRYFYETVELTNINSMSTAVDPINKLVIWNYPTTGNLRKLLIYNFKTSKWTSADAPFVKYVSDASTGVVTLEELDSIDPNIDTFPQSLDSSAYIGGQHFLGGTNGGNIYSYTGLPSAGLIISGDIDLGSNSVVTLARPQVDNGSATVAMASRKTLSDSISFSTSVAATSENRVSLRNSGRYHRVQVNPTGNSWKNAIAVDLEIVGQGTR